VSPSQPSDMFSGTADKGMAALSAGPLYTNAVMGTAPSAQQREDVRKASSTILRQDSIKVELSHEIHPPFAEQESRPDSLHYARTDQPPYVKSVDDKIMTQTSLLHLPKANASHDPQNDWAECSQQTAEEGRRSSWTCNVRFEERA
jgi:hypothetical protein